MSFETLYRRASELFNQETFLLVVFVLASGFALLETFRFDISGAARFPRLTGSAVLIGSLLLLFSRFLPDRIQAIVEQSADVFKADEEFEERQTDAEKRLQTDEEASTDANEYSTVGRPIHDSVFGAILVTLYGMLGFAIGILWATPLFVAVYGYWFKLPRYLIAILVVIGFSIAYGFMSVLGVPLDRGEIILTDGVF